MPRGQPRVRACVRACLTFYSDCVSWSLLITPCPNNTASTSAKRPAFGYYIFANIVCVQKEHIRTTAVPWAFPNLAGITEAKIAGDNKDNKPLTSTVWCRVVSHFSSHALRFTWIPWRSNSIQKELVGHLVECLRGPTPTSLAKVKVSCSCSITVISGVSHECLRRKQFR